ncbi:MAG: hypothetical protein KF898_04110 [Parachlamydiales bacterium]|nr:hypothetical protein [Verrucomicrobiota bacterium]MBX3718815.1 hypothetical protein [Candidatus Acheromyda pituitae]
MATTFNTSILDSYDSLRGYFHSSPAINQVLRGNNSLDYKVFTPQNPNLAGIWEVCQIITEPFRWLIAFVLKQISAQLVSHFGKCETAQQIKMASKYVTAGFNLLSDTPTKIFLLQKTRNRSNDHGIVSDTPPIPIHQILDPRVRNRTYNLIQNEIIFSYPDGICRGISDWFLFIYLKTKDQFTDHRSHMAALGKLFSKGGDAEPTLLQSLYLKNGKILDLKIGMQTGRPSGTYGAPITDQVFCDWKNSSEAMIQEIGNLPAGSYQLCIPFHQMTYVKINDQLGFLLDPNEGVLEINGEGLAETLYSLILDKSEKCIETAIYIGKFRYLIEAVPSLSTLSTESFISLIKELRATSLHVKFFPVEMRTPAEINS